MSNSLREPLTGEFRWAVPGAREIAIAKAVMQDIDRDVREVFAQVPRRGAETGGILLGRMDNDRVSIESSEPVRSEHRFGPLYRLSDDDRQKLAISLAALRHGRADGLSVVGFYRSLARPEFGAAEEDVELLWGHFHGPERLLLVLQPHPLRGTTASFYLWANALLVQAFPPMPFPFTDAPAALPEPELELPRPAAREIVPEPPRTVIAEKKVIAEPEQPPAVPAPDPPPERPMAPAQVRSLPPRAPIRSREEPEEEHEEGGGWFRIAAAAVLAIGGCSLGYLGMRQPDQPAPAPRVQHVTKPTPVPVAPPVARPPEPRPPEAASSAAVEHKTPEPPKPTPEERPADQQPPRQAGIYESLDRWASAMRRGDASAAAALYAPRVTDYLGRRNVTRQQVRERLRGYLGTRNRMDIYRVSDVAVSRVRDGEVEVTFQKHWQSGGYRKLSGDARERMVLVRNRAGQWEIASEQELPLR